ncbi:MAG: cytochrome c, partial [Chloroflexota bacterium]
RAPPHNASGHTWHHGDRLLLESIRLGGTRLPDDIGGVSEMPAFEGVLDEQQMRAILTYIKSTWPEDIRQVQWEQTAREP